MKILGQRYVGSSAISCLASAMFFLADVPLFSQESYPHHNITIGVGGAIPSSKLSQDVVTAPPLPTGNFLSASPILTVNYGYRFQRYLQADIGFNIAFGAAQVRDFLQTGFGDFRIRDREYMIPFGGRAILPLMDDRLLLSAGGGGVYLRYAEGVRQPSQFFRIDCPVCTSRTGWGGYGLADISYFLDQGRHFRLGVTAQYIYGRTNGDPLGDIPSLQTTDRWSNIFANFGVSF